MWSRRAARRGASAVRAHAPQPRPAPVRWHGDGGALSFLADDGVIPSEARRVIMWGAGVNVALGALKVSVGTAAGSPSLVADGVHSVSDIVSDGVTLVAMRVARLPADGNHLFGHGRVEAIGTLGVSTLLMGAAAGIVVHSYHAASELLPLGAAAELAASAAATSPALLGAFATAVVAIGAKEWLFRWTAAVASRVSSSTLQANAWHHRSDAFSSVVAAAGIAGSLAGVPLVDPAGGVVVAAMIAKQAVDMGVGALRELSDEAADDATTEAIKRALAEAAPREILSLRRLRTRVLGHYVAAEAEIGVRPSTTLTAADALARVAEAHVRRCCPAVTDLSVAVRPHEDDGEGPDGGAAGPGAGPEADGKAARAAQRDPSALPLRLPGEVEDDVLARVVRAVPAVRRVTHLRLHFLPGGYRCTAEMEIELRDFEQTVQQACGVAAAVRREAEAVLEVVRADVHLEVSDDPENRPEPRRRSRP